MPSTKAKPKDRKSDSPPGPVLQDDTRSRLIDSAGRVFAESGFHAATVREICARAGVNIALVNYHFGDKLELYTEVLRQSIGASGNGIIQKALQSNATPEAAFRELVFAMLQRVCRQDRTGWQFRLMIHELAQPTPAMASVMDETMRPIYDRFRSLIGALLDLPADHDTTRLCTHSAIGQIVHYVHSRHVISRLWPDLALTPERLEQIATHISDFSLAYFREMNAPLVKRKK